MGQSQSPVQSAVPAIQLVIGSDIGVKHIPRSHRELPIKPCRSEVSDVVHAQRFVAESGAPPAGMGVSSSSG